MTWRHFGASVLGNKITDFTFCPATKVMIVVTAASLTPQNAWIKIAAAESFSQREFDQSHYYS